VGTLIDQEAIHVSNQLAQKKCNAEVLSAQLASFNSQSHQRSNRSSPVTDSVSHQKAGCCADCQLCSLEEKTDQVRNLSRTELKRGSPPTSIIDDSGRSVQARSKRRISPTAFLQETVPRSGAGGRWGNF